MYNLSAPEQINKEIIKLNKDGKTLFENKNLVCTYLMVNGKLSRWVQNKNRSSLVYILKLGTFSWNCKTKSVSEPIYSIDFLNDSPIFNNLNN